MTITGSYAKLQIDEQPRRLFHNWPSRSLEQLEDWCDERGISRSRGLEVRVEGDEWGVFAKRDYAMGEALCQIPKATLFSVKTSSLALPAQYLESAHSILHLALCLLHEFRLGVQSKFYGYIQSLPRSIVPLPAFWSIPELTGEDGRIASEIMHGTEIEREIRFKANEGLSLDDVRHFYTAVSSHLPPTPDHPDPSPYWDYLHAYSLVCSRAFAIDLYHTVSLCPFADLFNHSSFTSHTSLSADDFVCHICGSLKQCLHDVQSTSGVVRRLDHLADDLRRKLEMEEDTVELRVDKRRVKKDQEIFNSYGDNLGDARLLAEWGFIEPDSIGGNITFDPGEVKGGEKWSATLKEIGLHFNVDAGDDHLIGPQPSDRPETLIVDVEGSVSIKLFALIVLGQSTENEDVERTVSSVRSEVENAWTMAMDEDEDEDAALLAARLNLSDRARYAVQGVIDLLGSRLTELYRHDLTLEELHALREGVDYKLQRMALAALINERRLLESTREKWVDLLDMGCGGYP